MRRECQAALGKIKTTTKRTTTAVCINEKNRTRLMSNACPIPIPTPIPIPILSHLQAGQLPRASIECASMSASADTPVHSNDSINAVNSE